MLLITHSAGGLLLSASVLETKKYQDACKLLSYHMGDFYYITLVSLTYINVI